MSDFPAQNSERVPTHVWPADPSAFVDTALCPSCFAQLRGPVCHACALDLRTPRATELLADGQRLLRAEESRQSTIARMRREQAQHEQAMQQYLQHQPAASFAQPVAATPLASPPVVSAPTLNPPPAQPAHTNQPLAPKRSGVQVLLLTLGIVLVSVAAIFFVLIAYVFASLELRSIMTATASIVALAVAWLLRSRGVRGTAEGVAIFGVVLLLLDVWIVRANDLFGSSTADWRVYTGVSLLILAAVLIGISAVTRLRTSRMAAATLAPFGVGLAVLGALRHESVATAWWAALLAVAAVSLASRALRWPTERTIVRSFGFTCGVLALGFAAAALPDAAWTRILTFGALTVVWGAHALSLGSPPRASPPRPRSDAWSTIAAIAAGLSAALAVVVPTLVLGDVTVSYWAAAPAALALGTLVLVAARSSPARSSPARSNRQRLLIAGLWPVICVGSLAAIPALGYIATRSLASTVVAASRNWTLLPLQEIPHDFASLGSDALGSDPQNWAAIVGVTLCAVVCLVALRILSRVPEFLAVPMSLFGVALIGASFAAGNIAAVIACLAAVTAAALVTLLVTSPRLTTASRIVAAVIGCCSLLLLFTFGFACGWLWPLSSAAAIAAVTVARVYIRRIAPSAARRVLAPALTAAISTVGAIAIARVPNWLWGNPVFGDWRADAHTTLSAPGIVDNALWVATAATLAMLVAALLSPRRLPRADTHALSVVAACCLVFGTVTLAIVPDGAVAARTAQVIVAAAVAVVGVVWLMVPRHDAWPQRLVAAATTPLSVLLCAIALTQNGRGGETAAAILIPATAVLGAAGSIAIFHSRRSELAHQQIADQQAAHQRCVHHVWDATTAVVILAAFGWALAASHDIQWVAFLVLSPAPLLLASAHGSIFTGSSWRRHVAWAALPLAITALWSLLGSRGVSQPEPYTLPVAALLIVLTALVAWQRPLQSADKTRTESAGRTALFSAAAVIAVLPSVLASTADQLATGINRPITLVVGGGVVALAGVLLPSRLRGIRLRLVLTVAGAVAALGAGAIQSVLATDSRNSAMLIEAWIAPGLAAAVIAAVFWLRRANRPIWIGSGLIFASVFIFVLVESYAIGQQHSATVRILVALGLLGAGHVASVVMRLTQATLIVRLVEWLSLAGMIVIAATALLSGAADPFEMATVPVAIALGAAGLIRMDEHANIRSWPQLGPACTVLLVPSLIPDFFGSQLWRILALAVVAIVIVIAAAARRLQAPLLISAAVLIVHAVAQLWPWISAAYATVPWWLWLGIGGVILIVLAARYEHRINNLRSAARSISALR